LDGNLYCLGCVGVIFILVAVLAAFRSIKDWKRYRESEGWISATGQIIASHVTSSRGTKSTTYHTYIVYTYQVMGQGYQSGQFSFGSEGTGYETHKKAESICAKYPEGSQTTIYYDPNDPQQAVLQRKFDSTGAILAVIFGLVGVGIIVYSYLQLSTLGYLGK
jgi:hypothetical protein